MKNPTHIARPTAGKDQSKAGVEEADMRSANRQPFIAEAQVVEVRSGTRLMDRTSDLAIQGCYVDCLNTFAVGTLVRTRLKKGEAAIEADGNVVYQMPGLGMGIAFRGLSPENRSALEGWISQASMESTSSEASTALVDHGKPGVAKQSKGQFVELVRLLVKKAVLTESEASGPLKAPAEE